MPEHRLQRTRDVYPDPTPADRAVSHGLDPEADVSVFDTEPEADQAQESERLTTR